MASETAGPPAGQAPGEHPEVADQSVAGSGGAVPAGDAGPSAGTATAGDAAPPGDTAPAGDGAPAGGTAAAVATAAGTPPPGKPRKHRKLLSVTLPSCWGAIIFACLSFTPSLLPRGGLIQGIICGITTAIGYGLGVWAASIWHAFTDRRPRQPRRWA